MRWFFSVTLLHVSSLRAMLLHDRILKGTEILSTSVSKSTHLGVGSIAGSRTASPDLMVTFCGLTFVRDNFIRIFIYHEVELIAQKRRCAQGGRGGEGRSGGRFCRSSDRWWRIWWLCLQSMSCRGQQLVFHFITCHHLSYRKINKERLIDCFFVAARTIIISRVWVSLIKVIINIIELVQRWWSYKQDRWKSFSEIHLY